MFASRPLHILLALLVAICIAQASVIKPVEADGQVLDERQEPGNEPGNDADSTPTSVPIPPEISSSTSESSLITSSSISSTEPSPVTSTSTTSSIPEQTSTSTTSTTSELAPPTSESSQAPPPSTSEQPESTNVPMSTYTSITTKTRSDGSKETETKTGALPAQTDKSSGSSGMSDKTRQTVIGVVVGIGGAIVLAALGLVGWRIWGRQKHNEEQDGLMDYNMGTGGVEKHEPTLPLNSGSQHSHQQTPFQSTLENYHQPGNVNASSNF